MQQHIWAMRRLAGISCVVHPVPHAKLQSNSNSRDACITSKQAEGMSWLGGSAAHTEEGTTTYIAAMLAAASISGRTFVANFTRNTGLDLSFEGVYNIIANSHSTLLDM